MLYLFNVIALIFAGATSTVSTANVIANSIEASNPSKGISFNTDNASSDQSIPPTHEAFGSRSQVHPIGKLERRNTTFMNTNLDTYDPDHDLSEISARDHVSLDTKPDTYAILLVSFGLVSIALRRRKIARSNKFS